MAPHRHGTTDEYSAAVRRRSLAYERAAGRLDVSLMKTLQPCAAGQTGAALKSWSTTSRRPLCRRLPPRVPRGLSDAV